VFVLILMVGAGISGVGVGASIRLGFLGIEVFQ
jgi:hypothetical protein